MWSAKAGEWEEVDGSEMDSGPAGSDNGQATSSTLSCHGIGPGRAAWKSKGCEDRPIGIVGGLGAEGAIGGVFRHSSCTANAYFEG